jgi:hypothetical protein
MIHHLKRPSLKDKHQAGAEDPSKQLKRGRGRPRGNVQVTVNEPQTNE